AGRRRPARADRSARFSDPRRRPHRDRLARRQPCADDRSGDAELRRQLRPGAAGGVTMPAAEIITFGCRLNAFEGGLTGGAAAPAGLADAVIVNTCAVTAEAERQARQAIRRARRDHPAARIIVTGCAATLAPARYAALPEVDAVLDNDAKLRPASY